MSRMGTPGWAQGQLAGIAVLATALTGAVAVPAEAVEPVAGAVTVSFGTEPAWSTPSGDPVLTALRPEIDVSLCVGEQPGSAAELDLQVTGDGIDLIEAVSRGLQKGLCSMR